VRRDSHRVRSPPVLTGAKRPGIAVLGNARILDGLFGGGPTSTSPSSDQGHYLLTCLGSGSQAAAQFTSDLAAAKAMAARTAPLVPVEPSSHEPPDLAVWLAVVKGGNSGCESCGGARFTTLDPVTWQYVVPLTPGGSPWDGHIGAGLFSARCSSDTAGRFSSTPV
jgi:hypothetical protein